MKKCLKCGAALQDDDVFCRSCGTNQTTYKDGADSTDNQSMFMKYSGYLNDEALYKVAWAKEQGIVKSAYPTEAEEMYQSLAIKNHLESMFRLAMIQLAKQPPETDLAIKWLKFAAEKGHVASANYLRTMMPDQYTSTQSFAPAINPSASVGTGNALSGEDVFAKMQNSVVEIIANDRKSVARASGFIVSSTGFVVTNAHAVLDDKHRIYENIQIKRGDEVVNAAVVAVGKPADGKHDSVDLALLFAIGLMDAGCAELGSSDTCRNGQKVYLIGNSLGSGTCITSGIISDARRDMPGLSYPYVMTDAAANHGNSGGPLLSEDGKVIGVLVSGIQNAEGMNYAIPIDIVKQFLAYVAAQTQLSTTSLAEISDIANAPVTMSSTSDKVFTGIHLVLDIIAFIMGLF